MEKTIEKETVKSYKEEIAKLKQENDFLRERENKLQLIEQMFKSGTVDLNELAELVEEKQNNGKK